MRTPRSFATSMLRRPAWLTLAAVTLLAPALLFIVIPRLTAANATSTWPGVWSSTADNNGYGDLVLLPSGKVFAQYLYGEGTARVYDPVGDTWTYTSPMGHSLETYAFTPLSDGREVVIGYYPQGYSSVVSVTATYDPTSDTWAQGQPMAEARDGYATAPLEDGRVLVIGGQSALTGAPELETDVYDPSTDTWSAAGSLPMPLFAHALTLQDGRVMLYQATTPDAGCTAWCMGKYSQTTRAVELYDPRTGAWSHGTDMPADLAWSATATLLPSGQILFAGGEDASGQALATTYLYDPTANIWSAAAPMLTARFGHASTLLVTGQVLVAGGETGSETYAMGAEVYDPASNTWQPTADMPRAHGGAEVVQLASGQVLISGNWPPPGSMGSLPAPTDRYAFARQAVSLVLPQSGGYQGYQDLFSPLPQAPTNVQATAGPASATITWTQPIEYGGGAVTGDTITAQPGGKQMTVTGGATSATLSGLTPGTSYTFTVAAINAAGTGPASASSNAVTPTVPPTPVPTATRTIHKMLTPTPVPTANPTPLPTPTATPNTVSAFGASAKTPPSGSNALPPVVVVLGVIVALLGAGTGLFLLVTHRGVGLLQRGSTDSR